VAGEVPAQVSPRAPEFQVNSYTTGNQANPAVAADASGSFVVAWSSPGSAGTDASGFGVQAQLYDAAGVPVGGEFQVNSYTTGFQVSPTVGADPLRSFVVAWKSSASSGTDASGDSIQARIFDWLFRDGFESGDGSRWSAVVG
jgi:hypothetical protein